MARAYFRFMGAVWSCTAATLADLEKLAEDDKPFELDSYPDVREIRRAPAGVYPRALSGGRGRRENSGR